MKIVAFLCTWCSYAGADLAGTGRNQYPPDIRVIRIPCSGRINPIYIIKALLEGADGVMVSGCHPGDCHYLVGNYFARRRFVVLKQLLTAAGFDENRVQFTWVSASEGARFADVVKDVTQKVAAAVEHEATQGENARAQGDGSLVLTQGVAQGDGSLVLSAGLAQGELIPLCKKLLEDGTVDTVIGFQIGGEMGLSLPYFVSSPDEADKFVWNNRCVPMLADYLRGKQGKTAIVAKPCDARAVVNLIKENQLKRDDVYIIGMSCDGIADSEGKLLPACADCTVKTPPVYDVLIGEEKGTQGENASFPNGLRSKTMGTGSPVTQTIEPSPCLDSDRFQREMEKCILCYSCRQSCYGCYCKTCFVERGEPDWQTAEPDIGAKMLYHLGRAMHLAGRCVECGACENACASGVDIRYLIKSITDFIEETYDYKTGMDLETEPAMLTYKADDPETGFQCFGKSENTSNTDTEGDITNTGGVANV